jgi:hypothetical protein
MLTVVAREFLQAAIALPALSFLTSAVLTFFAGDVCFHSGEKTTRQLGRTEHEPTSANSTSMASSLVRGRRISAT